MDKILIVDDAELNRGLLASVFEDDYEVLEACDGVEACERIDEFGEDITIIFLDLMMPRKNGLEVMEYMRQRGLIEVIPVVMITGESTESSDIKAYEYGAADIIYKPFSAKVVTRRAMNLIELYKHRNAMEAELERRTEQVVKLQQQTEKMNEFLLDALGSIVEFRSSESGEHVKRVMLFTRIILDYIKNFYPEYGLTERQIDLMSQAAALHDVGKIAIPDDILKAPRKLTQEEFNEMKKHTTYGCEILQRFKMVDDEFYQYCYDICRWHHEKVDGNGYPDRLVGNEIPIYCQAAAIADCFDALVSKRVYKSAVACQEAYKMITHGECGAFSPEILRCFEMAKLEMFVTVDKMRKEELA